MGTTLRITGVRIEERELSGEARVSTGRGPVLDGERRSFTLIVETQGGARGVGEATPLPRFSPESAAQARQALAAIDLGAVSIPLDDNPVAEVAQVVSRVPASVPSARFAVETALLDAVARAQGVPLVRLLGRGELPLRRAPLSALLDEEPGGDLIGKARAAIERGARTVKWKVGRPGAFAGELLAVARLRAAIGPDVALRLDANGGLPDDELEPRLALLAALGPELVEEPSPSWLAANAAPPCPLAADESLLQPGGPALVEEAIGRGRCAAVVLKPMLLGGVLAARAIARRAQARGAAVIVTHCFDGPIAMGAAAALAVTLGPLRAAAGLWPHAGLHAFGLSLDEAWVKLPFLDGGSLVPAAGPGHGVELP